MNEPTDDKQLERKIVRSLDGRLSPAEQAELDRELLRDPHARRLRDDYAAVDRLAAEALEEALMAGGESGDGPRAEPAREALCRVGASEKGCPRWRVALPGIAAAAAAAGLAVGVWWMVRLGGKEGSGGATGAAAGAPSTGARTAPMLPVRLAEMVAWPESGRADRPQPVDALEIAPVIERSRTGGRLVDRQFFEFFDEAGEKLYLFELNRARTIVRNLERDL